MATNNDGDWRDLFDVALFEPNRAKLRRCIEHAKHAIHHQLEALTHDSDDGGGTTAERIALSDALTTLATQLKSDAKTAPDAGKAWLLANAVSDLDNEKN